MIVTAVPTGPEVTERLVMLGVPSTVKLTPLLALLDTVTTTFPVVAPLGTVTVMLVALQLVAVAAVPLNLTVLVPWVDPKFDPAMVIVAPTAPEFGVRLVMLGPTAQAWPAHNSRRANKEMMTGLQFLVCIYRNLQSFLPKLTGRA